MTAEELAAFIADVRVRLEQQEALLDATDRESLEPEARIEYDRVRAQCQELRAMIDPEAVQLQVEAAILAGRDLTLEEAKALVRKQ